MKLKLLKERIEDLRIALDVLEHETDCGRNSGGCGFVALVLYKHLSKLYPARIRAIGIGSGNGSIHAGNSLCRAKNIYHVLYKKDITLAHIVVEITINGVQYYVDSDGVYSHYQLKKEWMKVVGCAVSMYDGGITEKTMKKMWDAEECWNTYFDRSYCDEIASEIDWYMRVET
jgi:hypothetical protein